MSGSKSLSSTVLLIGIEISYALPLGVLCYSIRQCFGISGSKNFNLVNENLEHSVILDTLKAGNDVVIIKNGHRICGTGVCLANISINQDKAYFEFKLQQEGQWGVGLSNKDINLNCVPLSSQPQLEANYCVFTNDAEIIQDGKLVHKLENTQIQLNDVIRIAFDHIELQFFLNDKPIDKVFRGLKGELYPVCYVNNGAILDATFSQFQFDPPTGYDRIMIEKSLL